MLSDYPTKTCSKCSKEKPLTEFPLRKHSSRDGYYAYCKRCRQDWLNAWRITASGSKSIKNSRSKETWKQNHLQAAKRHQSKYPDRRRARYMVVNAVRSGRLIKPDACEKCLRVRKVQSHHHLGYSLEHALDVQWLCIRCHREADGFILSSLQNTFGNP